MKAINWGPIFQAVAKAFTDFRANTPPAPATPISGQAAADALRSLQAQLPDIIAALDAHPGLITAADDILEALDAQGVTWASEVEAGVNAAPAGLATADKWLPDLIWALTAFQPAATGIPGGFSGARGHIL